MNDELKKIGEMKGWTLDETKQALLDWWKAGFKDAFDECKGNLEEADEDYQDWLIGAFQVTQNRKSASSGSKGTEYVGMIVAYKGVRDTKEDARQLAVTSAMSNLQAVLTSGIKPYNNKEITVPVCRAYFQEDKWLVANAQDQVVYTEEGRETDIPAWAIAIPNQKFYVCMMNRNSKPMDAFSYERTWLFVGNEADKLLSQGPFDIPITLKCRWDAGMTNLRMNTPIRFKAEKIDYKDGSGFLLQTGNIEPNYGLGWVEDEHLPKVEKLFDPAQYLTQFVPHLNDLTQIFDYHEQNSFESSYSANKIGPTFSFKGTVEYIDYVGRELEWAEGGTQFSMRISSNSMRREDANSALYINLSKGLEEHHNAFKVNKNDEWREYTTGTQVIVVGKTRTYERNDGDIGLNIDAYNIYAIPSRAFIAETPTEDSNDLGGLDGFRSD